MRSQRSQRGEPTTQRPRNDPAPRTPEEDARLAEAIDLDSFVYNLSPEEFALRTTNLMVRLQNHHPTNHHDVLILKRLLDEANEALEDAQEKHDAEIAELKDELAHIRNYPDC